MISVVFSPNPIITTPILCKYLDRERDWAIWWDGPPTRFMLIRMRMILLKILKDCSSKIATMHCFIQLLILRELCGVYFSWKHKIRDFDKFIKYRWRWIMMSLASWLHPTHPPVGGLEPAFVPRTQETLAWGNSFICQICYPPAQILGWKTNVQKTKQGNLQVGWIIQLKFIHWKLISATPPGQISQKFCVVQQLVWRGAKETSLLKLGRCCSHV